MGDSELDRILDAVPEDVVGLCRRLAERGKRGWVVGGCVRDLLRGAPAKDWDLATDARPNEVRNMFARVIPTGLKHGTVTVLVRGEHYEVTTLRGEGAYADGRRPDEVVFLDDIVEDLARRDFTFNSMAIDPLQRCLIDPFNGRGDLEAKLVRAVGDANERFGEDGLRILRAARFAATMECEIEDGTLSSMGAARSLDTLKRVSAERVHDEWLKTMRAARPSVGFDVLRDTRALDLHCPELRETVGCELVGDGPRDVWGHSMAVVDACPQLPVLRIAALLHDIGKPHAALAEVGDRERFSGHEELGAELAATILKRLKFSNEDRCRVVDLVRHHRIEYSPDWNDAMVLRWIRRVTTTRVDDLLALARANSRGSGHDAPSSLMLVDELQARVATALAGGAVLSARDLAIGGKDLMAELGLKPGPMVGELLAALLEHVTDSPTANDRRQLLEEAQRMLDQRAPR